MSDLNDDVYNEFLSLITKDKILNFHNECRKYQIKHHLKQSGTKISKNIFLHIFSKLFKSQNYFLRDLFELFFEKFRCQKCIFKQEKTKDLYSLREIIPIEEIEMYNVSLALITFLKTDFENKLKILFDLTDYDNDGLINEREIKKMFFSLNLLFSSVSSDCKLDSNLIYRSLANIKASRYYNMLMYNPGDLYKIIKKEKFINFETFYNGIQKIKDYKFNLFPFYINLKEYLETPNLEIEYSLNENVVEDFVKVSNNLISNNYNCFRMMHSNSEKIMLRKLFDNKKEKKNFVQLFLENKKKEKEKEKERFFNQKIMKKQSCPIIIQKRNIFYQNNDLFSIKNMDNSFKKSILNQSTRGENSFGSISSIDLIKEKKKSTNNINKFRAKSEDCTILDNINYEKADYDKFNSIEFPPCKINSYRDYKNNNLVLPIIKVNEKNLNNESENHSYLLKTYDEIEQDIDKILSKKKYISEKEKEHMSNIMKKIQKKAFNIRKKLINQGNEISSSFFKIST
jgi:hypothetical protein